MSKYIFITGGVLSGVGKGTITASIGKILQVRGYSVTAIKIDPYLNYDSGTMNPYMHGEVFVTEDGSETDLDLGHYERFLNINLSADHYITTGQVYWTVISRERRGDYLGQCVQIIPHITDEIKRRIRVVARKTKAELVLVEIGGTVGDIESLPFLEAIRQMRLDEGYLNTLFVHVSLVPILDATGEFKTKPTQHSVQELRRIGIQPDIIVARSREYLPESAKKKIALYGSVEERAVFCSPNVRSTYEVPVILDKQGMGDYICERLRLSPRTPNWQIWQQVVDRLLRPKHSVKIAICGKYAKLADSYVSINEALKHAGIALNAKISISWIETEDFEEKRESLSILDEYDGVLIPGGFGSRGAEGKILAINYARTHKIPFLGICFGFQLALVEYARNVCKLEEANSTEIDANTPHPVIDLLPEQKEITEKGATMRLGAKRIVIKKGTLAHKLYNKEEVYERHRHRYEVNPDYWDVFTGNGLIFSGVTEDGQRVEILELPGHPFFMGTQYHPEFKSRPTSPSPIFLGFVKAALDRKMRVRARLPPSVL